MAKIETDFDGSATITMSKGLQIRIPGLHSAPNVTDQDIRNVATAMLALANDLDNRLAALEKEKRA